MIIETIQIASRVAYTKKGQTTNKQTKFHWSTKTSEDFWPQPTQFGLFIPWHIDTNMDVIVNNEVYRK